MQKGVDQASCACRPRLQQCSHHACQNPAPAALVRPSKSTYRKPHKTTPFHVERLLTTMRARPGYVYAWCQKETVRKLINFWADSLLPLTRWSSTVFRRSATLLCRRLLDAAIVNYSTTPPMDIPWSRFRHEAGRYREHAAEHCACSRYISAEW